MWVAIVLQTANVGAICPGVRCALTASGTPAQASAGVTVPQGPSSTPASGSEYGLRCAVGTAMPAWPAAPRRSSTFITSRRRGWAVTTRWRTWSHSAWRITGRRTRSFAAPSPSRRSGPSTTSTIPRPASSGGHRTNKLGSRGDGRDRGSIGAPRSSSGGTDSGIPGPACVDSSPRGAFTTAPVTDLPHCALCFFHRGC
jgi:hypothetical protein